MSFNSVTQSLALVGLLGFTGVASAYECGVKSPRFLELGDAYYETGPTRDINGKLVKSKRVKERSNKILTALERGKFRTGTGTRIECSGKQNDTQVKRSEFKLLML